MDEALKLTEEEDEGDIEWVDKNKLSFVF